MIRPAALLALLVPALPAAGQEAARPARLETWYRVRHDDEPRGFAHELLVKTGGGWAYFYEASFSGGADAPAVALNVEGRLDEAFDPAELRLSRRAGDRSWDLTLAAGDKRRASFRVDGREAGSAETALDEACAWFAPIAIYRLSAAGLLDRPGSTTLLLPGPRGAAAPMTVAIGKPERGSVLGRGNIPLVSLSLPFPDGALTVKVDRYGRIVEQGGFHGADVVFSAVAGPEEADPEGRVAAQWRRDPFGKTLTRAEAGGPPPSPSPAGLPSLALSPDDVAPALAKIPLLLRDLRGHVAAERGDEAAGSYQAFLQLYDALRGKVARDSARLGPLDQAKAEAESTYGGCARLLARADAALAASEAHLDAANAAAVGRCADELRAMRTRREFINETAALARLMSMIAEVETREKRAGIRAELARMPLELVGVGIAGDLVLDRVGLDLDIAGHHLAVEEAVRLQRLRACAAINGDVYREGDAVAGAGVRVERILRQAVLLSWKGEVREVVLGKRSTR